MPVSRKTVHRRTLQQKGHDLGFVENLRDQLAIFQVIGGERRFIFVKAPVNLIHSVPGVVNGFALAKQLLCDRFKGEGREVPEGGFQRLNAVDNQAASRLGEEDAVFKTVFAPLQLAVAAPEHQRDAIPLGVFLQYAQVELHHVPADQDVGIVVGKPLVELLQQLWPAVNILKPEIQRGGITVRRPKHIDNAIAAAFKTDAVQFTVAGGFDIQRHPF